MHRYKWPWLALAVGLFLAARLPADESSVPDHFPADFHATRGWSLGLPVKAQPTPDGQAVLFLRSQPRSPRLQLFEFDVATGQTRELVTPQQVLGNAEETLSPAEKARRERMRVTASGLTDFRLSPDGQQVLLSLGGRLFLFDRAQARIAPLPTGDGPVIDPTFAPDGRSIAYVRGHDIYVLDLTRQKERPITRGGSETISHGLAEFVAQEEMDRFAGFWWSPDAKQIAYEEADASGVESWFVADPARPEQSAPPSFYPRPGKANVKARLGIVSAKGGTTTWVRWDATRHPYLVRVDWTKPGGLALTVQTRDQKELALLRVDPKSGQTTTLAIEHDDHWVNIDQQVPHWLADGRFLWTSERAGAWQLELRAHDGRLERVLVPPDAGYQGLLSVDANAGQVYYRASVDPTQSHLYRVPLAGGDMISLTAGRRSVHDATFAANHSIYVHTVNSLDEPPKTIVRRGDGTFIAELPSVAETPPFLPNTQIVQVGGQPGFWAKLIRPRGFDASERYPVVVHVYGGPHAQLVTAKLAGQFEDQWLADQGFIVVSIDGRGTPGRGRDWERAIHGQFGSVPIEDQVAGLQALGERFPELDLGRVGIHGWSFGGYMSALAGQRRPDVFKAAVAGAPVSDWLDYDTHYTERYLGVPENAGDEVYQRNSLLKDASKHRGALLLIHGTADDNVYFRHSLKLADALTRAGRPFEFLPLSGFTHLVPEPEMAEQLWRRRAAFLRQHLGGPEPR